MNNSPEGTFINDTFNLDPADVEAMGYRRDDQGNTIISIKLTPRATPCPDCGCRNAHIKNYVDKRINYKLLTDRKTTLIYRARRFICPVCRRTYYEYNPFAFGSQRISRRTVINVLTDLKDFNETMSSVARRYDISPTSVASIFDHHVDLSRNRLPEVLSIDENYCFKSDKSRYVCILLDFISQEPVDLLPSRRYDALASYLGNIPPEERRNVKVICTDMYEPYRSIARNYFRDARLSVDPFHTSQEFHRKMNNVRIRIMKGFNRKDRAGDISYYLLKKFNWILFKDTRAADKNGLLFDPDRERVRNRKLDRYLNLYDIREMILAMDTQLTEVYDLKLELAEFYRDSTYETAQKNLQELIPKFYASSIEEMNAFGRTLANWRDEIVNSFIIVKYDYKVNRNDGTVTVHGQKSTNSIIENRNKYIKAVRNNANGYTNWKRFRNRILYVLRKDATFSLFPREIPDHAGKRQSS